NYVGILTRTGTNERRTGDLRRDFFWQILARRSGDFPTREFKLPLAFKVPFDTGGMVRDSRLLNAEVADAGPDRIARAPAAAAQRGHISASGSISHPHSGHRVMGPTPRTDVPGIKRVAASEILEFRLAFPGGRPREGRLRMLLAALFPQRLDPFLRIRRDERLPARLPDEDLLPQLLPQAVEFLVHLPFLP